MNCGRNSGNLRRHLPDGWSALRRIFCERKDCPEGFKLDENAYYFEISEDGKIVDVENEAGVGFINQPITGKLELTKTDVADGKPLPNAGFRIKDEDGNTLPQV